MIDADDHAIISPLMRIIREAWLKSDSIALSQAFSPASRFVAFDGSILNGRLKTPEYYAALFPR